MTRFMAQFKPTTFSNKTMRPLLIGPTSSPHVIHNLHLLVRGSFGSGVHSERINILLNLNGIPISYLYFNVTHPIFKIIGL